MNIPREEKKIEAIEVMKSLHIIDDAIEQFKNDDVVMVSEPPFGALYWLNDEEKEEVRKFEKEYNALVYTVVRAFSEFGVLDSFLYISDYKEEWEMDRNAARNGEPMTYTLNRDEPMFSEFGHISVSKQFGGLVFDGLVREF